MSTITIEQNERCRFFRYVYIDGKCIGSVMADDTMTPFECYESLKNNWAIDEMESQHNLQIERSIDY